MILRKGDKGNEVIRLQETLNKHGYNLVVDGDFGNKTDEAVRAFQKSKNLVVDGIVGENTMRALGLTQTDEIKTDEIKITKAHINTHITKCAKRTPKYLVIHYTAGSSSAKGSAMKNRNVFISRKASADYIVDDCDIVEVNPNIANFYCWSVGDGNGKYGVTNTNSISIEMCSNLKNGYSAKYPSNNGWYFTEATLKNAVKIAKYLMEKYNIPLDRVIRHWDASRKQCPGVVGFLPVSILDDKTGKVIGKGNENDWIRFKSLL